MQYKRRTQMGRIITIFSLVLLSSIMAKAQNEWELPTENQQAVNIIDSVNTVVDSTNPDAKYLAGAVKTNEKGEVVFSKTIANDYVAKDNYERLLNYLTTLTKKEPALPESRLLLVNAKRNIIVAHFEEWMIFRSSLFELDRARFVYTLMAECNDKSTTFTINRISYQYEGNGTREKEIFKAENWIADNVALTKNKKKLKRAMSKFRKKTIDRVETIFKEFNSY